MSNDEENQAVDPAVVQEDTKAIVDGIFVCKGSGRVDVVMAESEAEADRMFRRLNRFDETVDVEIEPGTAIPRDGDEVIGYMLVRGAYKLLRD